jgi:hypothetical protein
MISTNFRLAADFDRAILLKLPPSRQGRRPQSSMFELCGKIPRADSSGPGRSARPAPGPSLVSLGGRLAMGVANIGGQQYKGATYRDEDPRSSGRPAGLRASSPPERQPRTPAPERQSRKASPREARTRTRDLGGQAPPCGWTGAPLGRSMPRGACLPRHTSHYCPAAEGIPRPLCGHRSIISRADAPWPRAESALDLAPPRFPGSDPVAFPGATSL